MNTLEQAAITWLANEALLGKTNDQTYEWLRTNFKGRWGELPPAFPTGNTSN